VKFRLNLKHGKCKYQHYNKKKKEMVYCGKKAFTTCNDDYVCSYHLPFALAADNNPILCREIEEEIEGKWEFKKAAGYIMDNPSPTGSISNNGVKIF